MRVTRYDDGGITRRQQAIELLVNGAIFFTSIVIATWISAEFGLIWFMVLAVCLPFVVRNLRFKLFPRVPPSQTVSYEGANIPPELLTRYERAEAEFQAVMDELQRLPTVSNDDSKN